MKRLVYFLIATAVFGAVGWWLSSNQSPGRDLLPDPTPVVRIDSISPASGTPIDTTVTLIGTGFSKENNDIGITWKTPQESQYTMGYINQIKSADGRVITFPLPSAVGVCPFSNTDKDIVCIELALILPNQELEIFVLNKGGESNRVKFTVENNPDLP